MLLFLAVPNPPIRILPNPNVNAIAVEEPFVGRKVQRELKFSQMNDRWSATVHKFMIYEMNKREMKGVELGFVVHTSLSTVY